MRKKFYIILIISICLFVSRQDKACAQELAVKSNLLYDLTATLNVGTEWRIADLYTIGLSVNYNPWTYGENKKMKQLLFTPEARRYFEDAFMGWFAGVHAFYGWYNWSMLNNRQKLQLNDSNLGGVL